MHIAIRHCTTYRYEEPVSYSVQSLRLSPPPFDGQRIIDWVIDAPGIDAAATFLDGFGNRVHLITVDERHQEITIDVSGKVETSDTSGLLQGLDERAPLAVYLRETELTRSDAAIEALAQEAKGEDVDRLHDLMRLVSQAIEYQPGDTDASTPAAAALARGRGVCQDQTHVFIAAARRLGIPARYVSGYLWATESAPLDAQHAWVEAHCEHLGWVGFDVTNGICPDPHYVRVACGLDYRYAAPVKGSRKGGGREALDVEVLVGAAQMQQQ